MNGGSGYNLIPDTMELKGTLRTYDNETREDVMIQIREKAETVARAFGAEAEVSFGEIVPPVGCAEAFTDEILGYASEIVGKERIAAQGEVKMGSEDFSFITEKYPDSCGYLFIGAGPNEEEGFRCVYETGLPEIWGRSRRRSCWRWQKKEEQKMCIRDREADGVMFICADHGNAEQLVDYETGEPFTAHTTNPVPFILVNGDPSYKLREGGALCDIVPTLIELMGMEQPKEMTGKSLLLK